MRYEIKKILSCKILMISMIVAFIFSMAISYNAYANEKINLREFSAYIGDFSEQKYDVIEQKVMELQNKYEETQNADVMNEMFVYLTLDKDALNCHNVVEYRDSVISDSEIKIKTESGYYKRMNETINKLYGKKTNLVIGESETLNEVYDLFCVTDIVDIVFIIVIILFSSYLFLNEHNNNTFYMIKSSYRGGKLSYRNKIVITLFFSIMASVVETLGMTIWSVFWNKIDQWNTSILLNNAFLHSPYSITLFEMIIGVVIMRAIGFFVLSSVFIFVSLFFKSNIVPIAINTFIGLGGIAINYILSGKYFALSGGTIREAENYDILRKYTPFPLISESVNYMLLTLKQHQLYVKNYQRNIEIPYQLYGLKVLRSAFSSLKGIAEDENYEYYYYDGLKKIYIFDKKEYGLVDSFPIIDKYFQGNTSLDDIREVMTYYKQPQQFINQLHELNYLSDKVHKKIMKKLK